METPDPLVVCPYNISHNILKSRMQFHLTKCRKQYPKSEIVVCPFDATHHVPEPEMRFHLQGCSNRKVVDNAAFVTTDSTMKAEIPAYIPPPLPSPAESWDDCASNTYDPSKKAAEVPVLRIKPGATKSEQKAFRQQERQRVQELMEKGYSEVNTSTVQQDKRLLRLPQNVRGLRNTDLTLKTEGSSSECTSETGGLSASVLDVLSGQGAGNYKTEYAVKVSEAPTQGIARSDTVVTSLGRGITSPRRFQTPANTASCASHVGKVSGDGQVDDSGSSCPDDPLAKFQNLSLSRGRGISHSRTKV